MQSVFLYTDGGSRGNPGHSATGYVVVSSDGKILHSSATYLGVQTNNYAEYQALLEGLDFCLKQKYTRVVCKLDSKLVVEQSLGHWKVKESSLLPLVTKVQKILLAHREISLEHIPREQNKMADKLVNDCLDRSV